MKRKHEELKHFGHPHDLDLIEIQLTNETPQKNCYGCNLPLFGSCYNCSACNFYLHQYCFDLPQSIQTQIHPQHTLSLLHSHYSSVTCNACGESCTNFLIFNCSFCNFNVHGYCTGLDETKCKDDSERYVGELLKQKLRENKLLKAKIDELQNKCSSSSHADHDMSIDQTRNEVDSLRAEQDEYYQQRFHQFQMRSNVLPTEVMEYDASLPKFDATNIFDQFF